MPRPAGRNSYWAFLMSERRARPHLTQVTLEVALLLVTSPQEELQVHVAKMWRKGGFDSYGRCFQLFGLALIEFQYLQSVN